MGVRIDWRSFLPSEFTITYRPFVNSLDIAIVSSHLGSRSPTPVRILAAIPKFTSQNIEKKKNKKTKKIQGKRKKKLKTLSNAPCSWKWYPKGLSRRQTGMKSSRSPALASHGAYLPRCLYWFPLPTSETLGGLAGHNSRFDYGPIGWFFAPYLLSKIVQTYASPSYHYHNQRRKEHPSLNSFEQTKKVHTQKHIL